VVHLPLFSFCSISLCFLSVLSCFLSVLSCSQPVVLAREGLPLPESLLFAIISVFVLYGHLCRLGVGFLDRLHRARDGLSPLQPLPSLPLPLCSCFRHPTHWYRREWIARWVTNRCTRVTRTLPCLRASSRLPLAGCRPAPSSSSSNSSNQGPFPRADLRLVPQPNRLSQR